MLAAARAHRRSVRAPSCADDLLDDNQGRLISTTARDVPSISPGRSCDQRRTVSAFANVPDYGKRSVAIICSIAGRNGSMLATESPTKNCAMTFSL